MYIVQIHLNTEAYPINKQVSYCLLQKTMLAAVWATDEQVIAPPYLVWIYAHPVFWIWTMCWKIEHWSLTFKQVLLLNVLIFFC